MENKWSKICCVLRGGTVRQAEIEVAGPVVEGWGMCLRNVNHFRAYLPVRVKWVLVHDDRRRSAYGLCASNRHALMTSEAEGPRHRYVGLRYMRLAFIVHYFSHQEQATHRKSTEHKGTSHIHTVNKGFKKMDNHMFFWASSHSLLGQ